MRKLVILGMITFSLILYWGWLLTMPNIIYSKYDFLKYYLLTYKEIRSAPRVSADFFFEYAPSDETDPQSSMIYFCKLEHFDDAYKVLMDYVISTGITLREGYSLTDYEKYDDYFHLSRTSVKTEPCLVLIYSVVVNGN